MKPLYVVAVSGGVDSVVLLDQLARRAQARLIVAHVDHGIRENSAEDAAFVATCAKMYVLPFESIRLELGRGASEEKAREARWEFLRRIQRLHQADAIVTAHHADDVVETMIINLLRGTGWRGIASLRETGEIKRPLLTTRKHELVEYTRAHELQWREDETNRDTRYLRNHVRHDIMPRCNDAQFSALFNLYRQQVDLRAEIEREVAALSPALRRYCFVMWPDEVACEVLRAMVGALTRQELARLLLFVRTARSAKCLELSNGKTVRVDTREFIVLGSEDC